MKEIREGYTKGNLRSAPKTKRPSETPAAHRLTEYEDFKNQLRERFAKFIHEDSWAHWMKHLFSKCEKSYDLIDDCKDTECVVIPADLVQRWKRQMSTAYEDLSEKEKESDRKIADKLMKLLEEAN